MELADSEKSCLDNKQPKVNALNTMIYEDQSDIIVSNAMGGSDALNDLLEFTIYSIYKEDILFDLLTKKFKNIFNLIISKSDINILKKNNTYKISFKNELKLNQKLLKKLIDEINNYKHDIKDNELVQNNYFLGGKDSKSTLKNILNKYYNNLDDLLFIQKDYQYSKDEQVFYACKYSFIEKRFIDSFCKTLEKDNNLYELIPNNIKVKPYFDLDEDFGENILTKEYCENKKNYFINKIIEFVQLKKNINLKHDDFIILNSSSNIKFSYHILINNGFMFDNNLSNKSFLKDFENYLDESGVNELKNDKGYFLPDYSVYGNEKALRLPNQSKLKRPNVFCKIESNHTIKDCLVFLVNNNNPVINWNTENKIKTPNTIKELKNLKNIQINKDDNDSVITENTEITEVISYDNNEMKQLKNEFSNEYVLCLRAIKHLSLATIDNYQNWLNACFIFLNEFDYDSGFNLWLEFSKRGTKFISIESLKEKWDYQYERYKDSENQVRIGSLIKWAKDDDEYFFINESESHFYSKKIINIQNIQPEYFEAIYTKNDRTKANLVIYLFPDYFVSDGEVLYIINYYGIFKKISGDGLDYLKSIYDGVIKNLERCKKIINTNKNQILDNDKITELNIKINKLIDDYSNVNPKLRITREIIDRTIEPKLNEKMDEISKHLIGFNNGVFDLENKIFRKGTKSDFVSLSTGYDYIKYDEETEKTYLDECYKIFLSFFRTEEYTKNILNRISFMMNGNNKRQELDFWVGGGGNGKSVLAEKIIKPTFGDYSTVLSSNYFMTADKDSGRATPELAQAKGTRFAFISEPDTNNNAKIQVNKLKILSGSDKIKCRFLSKNPIEYIPQFSLIFLVNELPELSSLDGGILRRPVIINFPFLFRKPEDLIGNENNPDFKPINPNLEDKCVKLKLFFFKLFVKFYDKNYQLIKEIIDYGIEFKETVNPIGTWFKEYFEWSPNEKDRFKLKDIVDIYNLETGNNITSKDLSRAVTAAGFSKPKKISGDYKIEKIKLKNNVENLLTKYNK